MERKSEDILSLKSGKATLLCAGGYNSIALFKTSNGAEHKYSNIGDVVVKFYRRGIPMPKFDEISRWQKEDFHKFDILKSRRFQQSVDAGIYLDKFGKTYCYSVLEYVDGVIVQDFLDLKAPISSELCESILSQLFENIIVPAWGCGLVFSDIQGRNLILRERDFLAMLDTEQMRSSAAEKLCGGNKFSERELKMHLAFHSSAGKADGNGTLTRFIKNILFAAFFPNCQSPEEKKSQIMSMVKREFFSGCGPASYLSEALNSNSKSLDSLILKSVRHFLDKIFCECKADMQIP